CTIIYKLILGVENEPFPNGNFPVNPQAPDAANAAQFGVKMPWQSVLTSDIARMVQVIPAGFADFYGKHAPWWLTGSGVLWSMGVWVLRHGYPPLSVEGWATLTAAATQLMWILPTAYFALKEARYLGRPEFADAIDAVITASGELMLVAGIFLDVYAKQP